MVGREFDFRLLSGLIGEGAEDQVLQAVDEAVSFHLVEDVPGQMDRYQFSHALIQQTLSEEVTTSRRVRLHSRIAEALEELYGDEAESHAAELAHHFAEAEPVLGPEKLVRYSSVAGEKALATYANEEAQAHFQRALAAEEGQPMNAEIAGLWFGLGRAQVATLPTDRKHEVITMFSRAVSYYAETGDVRHAVAVAEYPIAGFGLIPTGVQDLIEKVMSLVAAESHAAGRLLCRSIRAWGVEQGNYDNATEAFDRSMAIAQREGDTALEMRILASGTNVDFFHNRPRDALKKSLSAIQLAGAEGEIGVEVSARLWSSAAMMELGDLDGTKRESSAMLVAAERLGDRYWLVTALFRTESASAVVGDWQSARHHTDRALSFTAGPPCRRQKAPLGVPGGAL